jgi:hypothetical protein
MNDNIRKKILVLSILFLFGGTNIVLPSFNGNIIHITFFDQKSNAVIKNGERSFKNNFTHTVFIGVATSQNCPPCDPWNQNMHNVYSSEDYDFEYVEMIGYDTDGKILNLKAHDWIERYSIGAFPTSILDGDYKRIIGNRPKQLPSALNLCGNRTVSNITGNITLSWLGDAIIQVNISIRNNESFPYEGYVRVFISEIVSRYKTYNGSAYHFGFLDFAIDEIVVVNPEEEYIDSFIWDGKEHGDEQGNNFGDITANNTQVTLVIYDSEGYVDETTIDRIGNNPPREPSNPHPSNGETNVSIITNLRWACEDPDGDIVRYDVYFGNNSSPPIVSTNQTNTTYNNLEILDYNTTYYWKIIAWDEYGASTIGPLWHFTTTSPANLSVSIIKPIEKTFYLRNLLQFGFPFGTIVYGPIKIEANASSASGIKKVELYINDKFKKETTKEPYSFRWAPLRCGRYTIKIIATDNLDNQAYDEIKVLKWRAHPFLIMAGIYIILKVKPHPLRIFK